MPLKYKITNNGRDKAPHKEGKQIAWLKCSCFFCINLHQKCHWLNIYQVQNIIHFSKKARIATPVRWKAHEWLKAWLLEISWGRQRVYLISNPNIILEQIIKQLICKHTNDYKIMLKINQQNLPRFLSNSKSIKFNHLPTDTWLSR